MKNDDVKIEYDFPNWFFDEDGAPCEFNALCFEDIFNMTISFEQDGTSYQFHTRLDRDDLYFYQLEDGKTTLCCQTHMGKKRDKFSFKGKLVTADKLPSDIKAAVSKANDILCERRKLFIDHLMDNFFLKDEVGKVKEGCRA